MKEENVLCAASAYDRKYYFNNRFSMLPEQVQDELHIACVVFTDDVGGYISMFFEDDGTLMIDTGCDEGDYLYDEIGAGLLSRKMQREKQELFEQLELFYRVCILKQDIDRINDENAG